MAERELINTGTEKQRYLKWDMFGRFKALDDIGEASVADRRTKANTSVKLRRGDRSDQKER